MNKVVEGRLIGEGLKFGIVVSRFNEAVTSKLLEGSLDALSRHGTRPEDVTIVRVPGAFEIPVAAMRLAQGKGGGKFDAIICLGAVIRGGTPHFEYISSEVAKGVAQVGLASGIPTMFGVITADTLDQAVDRAGGKQGNKGWNAAVAAIEMADLFKRQEM